MIRTVGRSKKLLTLVSRLSRLAVVATSALLFQPEATGALSCDCGNYSIVDTVTYRDDGPVGCNPVRRLYVSTYCCSGEYVSTASVIG